MSDLLEIILDDEGWLGISNDFWLNTISELFVGVLIVGFFSLILSKYSKALEDRMRRYERSSKALRLYHYYSHALFTWSTCVQTLGAAVAHIIQKKDEPFDRVLDSQMASVPEQIRQIKDELSNINQWFEEHYGVYPVQKHKEIYEFQEGANEFCAAMANYNSVFERILMADRNVVKLGVLMMAPDTKEEGFKSFLIATKRYPELHTHAFAEFLLDTRPLKNSVMAMLDVKTKHTVFSEAIVKFSNFVTDNFNRNFDKATSKQPE